MEKRREEILSQRKVCEMKQIPGLLRVLFSCTLLMLFSSQTEAVGEDADVQIELQSSLSSDHIRPGDTVKVYAWMAKDKEVQATVAMKRYLRMSASVRQPDGSRFSKALFDNGLDGDVKAGDGVFTCQFTADWTGEYHVRIIAEGKGFRKEHDHLFSSVMSGQAESPPLQGEQADKAESTSAVRSERAAPPAFTRTLFFMINGMIALLWIAAFGYLFMRTRKTGPIRITKKDVDFRQGVQTQAEEKIKQLVSDGKKGQEGLTSDATVIADMHAARHRFLEGVIDGVKNSKEDLPAVWQKIYGSFDETVKVVLKDKKTALDEKDLLQEKVEEIGGITEELKGAKVLADAQARKIAFLLSFKDVIAESQQKFDFLKKKNKELAQKLFDAAHTAGVADAMKAPLAEFGENYKQLELCVATLEQENERLVGEIKKWQNELEQIRKQGPVTVGETSAEALVEKEDLKAMVRVLDESIRMKDKELAAALQRFESLEAEYMVLYQEKQAGQQQPDM